MNAIHKKIVQFYGVDRCAHCWGAGPDLEKPCAGDFSSATSEQAHDYVVRWPGGSFSSPVRHFALQSYVAKRIELNDFGPAEGRIVSMWCDGVEFYNVDEKANRPSAGVNGESCRQLTGMIRPFPNERHMP